MGGGDLNLKKSWHPSTLRNIERVWKAEQKHEQEQKKIEQLQRELAEERAREEMRQFAEDHGVVRKKEERLDWMYQGPAALVDKEQYLMGRSIDKTFEIIQQTEEGKQQIDEGTQPGAIFTQPSVNVTVDLANKVREDPLFTIRKHEVEQKKRLLDNPIKMKQLRQLIEQTMSKKKKKSKKSKSKKHKRKHNSSSSSDDDSDAVDHKKAKSLKQEDRKEDRHHHHLEKKKKKKSKRNHSDKDSSDENEATAAHRRDRKLPFKAENNARSHSRSSDSRPWGSDRDKRRTRRSRSRSRSPRNVLPQKRKLTEEELEQKRQEMLENASWREEQRRKNVKRYREEDEKDKQHEGKGADFIRPLLSNAALHGSVEGRIKQKVYNIQRSRFDMDKNFAKR